MKLMTDESTGLVHAPTKKALVPAQGLNEK
jgi:hypothetical protein